MTDQADDALVHEIHVLRDDMERMAIRMVELSQKLHGRVRRAPADDYTARYVMFANAWTRFGAMVEGAIRRTRGVTRLVSGVPQERLEASAKEVEKPIVPPPVQASTDLAELYGEEMVKYVAS